MKFTPGPAIAAASGSIGGTTFSHNRFGAYTRKRAIPTDPNTDRQQAVKANFGYLSSIWNLILTEIQRQGWAEYGANVPRIDKLGQTHYLTGLQWFVGFNTLRLQDGGAVLYTAPTTFNRGELAGLTGFPPSGGPSNPTGGTYYNISGGIPILNLLFDTAPTEGGRLMVYLGRPQNPTINFYKAPWRFWGSQEMQGAPAQLSLRTSGPPPTIGVPPYQPVEGQAVFVRLRMLYPDGRYTPPADYKLSAWDIEE